MTASSVVLQVLTGLASASALFLVASGLSLIFGVTRIVNFAHGSFYMLGLYAAVALTSFFAAGPLGFWAGVLIAAVAVAAVGALIEIVVLRRLYAAPELYQLLATFALVLVIRDAALWAWGPEDLLGPKAPGMTGAIAVLGKPFPSYDVFSIFIGPIVRSAFGSVSQYPFCTRLPACIPESGHFSRTSASGYTETLFDCITITNISRICDSVFPRRVSNLAMSAVEYSIHSHPARIGISALIPVLIFFMTGNGTAEAQQTDKNSPPSVTIIAPESVRNLLTTHFSLPTTPLMDETARATFMRRAHREIDELLATEGYFTPTIVLHLDPFDKLPVLEVKPGPRTTVAELSIEFTGDLAIDEPGRHARIEKLRAAWPLKAGQPFRSPTWEEAKSVLLSSVAEADYPAAVVEESKAEVDVASSSARLLVRVDSGPAFRYGNLVIKGLNRYG